MTDNNKKLAANFIEELRWRGLIYDITEGAEDAVKDGKITAYIGFDPTADSLHVGSLLPIMVLVHLQRHGHTPIALVGGGTGMIGDPSGKTKERQLLSLEMLEKNLAGIRAQLSHFLEFEGVENPALMLNNGDWLRNISFIEFLRDVGKHFTVNYMMAKESVKKRLEGDEGISFTEFSYMMLQSFDFLTLFRDHGCTFQMGGSDQWGNITAGTQLIRRIENGKAHGIVVPLVTTASGVKFGKSMAADAYGQIKEDNVWLDAKRTSPYKFFQFWLNTADDDAIKYLKFFTLLDQDAITALEQAVETEPHRRLAQRTLAEEVTRNVHGEAGLAKAQQATDVLFGGGIEGLSVEDLMDIFADVPSSTLAKADLQGEGFPLVDLVVNCGLESGKKRARTLIQNGGVNVNNVKVDDIDAHLTLSDAIEQQVIILRKGKKTYHLVQVQ